MNKLKDIISFICKTYPKKEDLSKARLNKIIYLCDWKSALDKRKQITNIKWTYNYYGPYVNEVIETVKRYPGDFQILQTTNSFGELKEIVILKNPNVSYESLSNDELDIINFIIEKSFKKTWSEFINLVYSTFPILTQEKFTELNLVDLSLVYKEKLLINNRS